MWTLRVSVFVAVVVLGFMGIQRCDGVVVGIDLGAKWMKMGVIRNNAFEIIMDPGSRRKIQTMVTFVGEDRYFGAEAERMSLKNPTQTYNYLPEILGVPYDSVDRNIPGVNYYDKLIKDESRGTAIIQHNETTIFQSELLVGMILRHAKKVAEEYLDTSVSDVVITVPPYLNLRERESILAAAKVATLNVLSLLNDGAAWALHYAFGRKFSVEEPQFAIFYDIGHASTSATLVEMRAVPQKRNKTLPTLRVRGVGYDRTLGGRVFTERLTNRLKEIATESLMAKGYLSAGSDLANKPRAMIKLRAAAEKAKSVLSVNKEAVVNIEGLYNPDYDFHTLISRDEFETLCADLFARVTTPIEVALAQAELTLGNVTNFEIVGGGVRVPKVQETLQDYLGEKTLDKHINGDDAAAYGAVFFAAQLSTTMRVPNYRLKDVFPYTVRVDVTLPPSDEENEEAEENDETDPADEEEVDGDSEDDVADSLDDGVKSITLFKNNSRLGALKNVKFSSRGDDFSMKLMYIDSETEEIISPIALYNFTGMAAVDRYNYTKKPKVQVSFRLTTSGVIDVEKAEAVVSAITYPNPVEEERKLKAAIDDLIREYEEKKAAEDKAKEDKEGDQPDTEGKKEENPKEGDEEKNETEEGDETAEEQDGEAETGQDENESEDEESKNNEEAGADEDEDEADKNDAEPPKPKIVQKVIQLDIHKESLDLPGFSAKETKGLTQIILSFEAKEKLQAQTALAKNSLESYIYSTKDLLYEPSVMDVSTEEERDDLRESLSDAGEWLYDEGEAETLDVYKAKLKELQQAAKTIFFRVEERSLLPQSVGRLMQMINKTRRAMVNITKKREVEEEEVAELLSQCDEVTEWLQTKAEEYESAPRTEDPIITSKDVDRKTRRLEIDMKSLKRRAKRKPPKKIKPVVEKPEGEEKTDEDNNEDSKEENNDENNENNEEIKEAQAGDAEEQNNNEEGSEAQPQDAEDKSAQESEGEEGTVESGSSEEVGEEDAIPNNKDIL